MTRMLMFAALLVVGLWPVFAREVRAEDEIVTALEDAREAWRAGDALRAYEAAYDAMVRLFQEIPLQVRTIAFVTGEPAGYGMYEPRPDNRFRPGERMLLYLEPLGYRIVQRDDMYEYGLSADLLLLTPDGRVLGGQENFFHQNFSGHVPATQTYLVFNVELTGLPAGAYQLAFVIHDLYSPDQSTRVRVPMIVTDAQ